MADAYYQFELNDEVNTALSDITHITADKNGSYRLSRPSIWTGSVPCDRAEVNTVYFDGYPYLSKNRRLKVRRDGQIVHNGIIMNVARKGDRNGARATFTSVDPRVWWGSRMAQEGIVDIGNIVDPDFGSTVSGPEILQAALANTIEGVGSIGIDWASGTFEEYGQSGVPDLSLILADWPKTIADLATLLINTGFMDVTLRPVDTDEGFRPDIMGVVSAVTEAGQDQPSVSFDYGTGFNSIGDIDHVDSMETLSNRLYMYFGPKVTTERWQGLITADDEMPHQPSLAARRVALLNTIYDSRFRFGVWMNTEIYETALPTRVHNRAMYEALWLTEQYLRVNGREMVTFTPTSDCPYKPFVDYDLGDTPRLNINADKFGVGFDNVSTRIYGFDIMPSLEGAEMMGPMITSADAE